MKFGSLLSLVPFFFLRIGLAIQGLCVSIQVLRFFYSRSVKIAIGILIVKVLVTQLCLTLCDSRDCSLPGSTVHGILQAGILQWIAIPSSRGSSDPGIEPGSVALQADSLPSGIALTL